MILLILQRLAVLIIGFGLLRYDDSSDDCYHGIYDMIKMWNFRCAPELRLITTVSFLPLSPVNLRKF